MEKILVAGAGKSAGALITYLLTHAGRNNWQIVVADADQNAIAEKTGGHPAAIAAPLDITDGTTRKSLVRDASIVVSLLPPHLHILLAKDCLEYGRHIITSSYVSEEMRDLHRPFRQAGLMAMCEMGLDPGIDHMSASAILHSILRISGITNSFRSYCGGLIAPESDNNPWHYKFSWNPRNIVNAGKDGAVYLEGANQAEVSYAGMFKNAPVVTVPGGGRLAWYPNRDSLKYIKTYELQEAHTFLRATLRHPDFSAGWDALVQLRLTDDQDAPGNVAKTLRQWVSDKAGVSPSADLEAAVRAKTGASDLVMNQLSWLGLFKETAIARDAKSSADILYNVLLEKWEMKPEDKDMVVMQHEIEYTSRNQLNKLCSTMVIKGDDRAHSAMSKTVGLPMAILTRAILRKKINAIPGVHIPTSPFIYRPVLTELRHHGIVFTENVC